MKHQPLQFYQSTSVVSREGLFRMQHCLDYVNDAFCLLFRFDASKLKENLTFYELLVDTEVADDLKHRIESGRPADINQVLFKRFDGSNFWGSLRCSMIDNGSVVGSIVDVSEQVVMDKSLREKQLELEKMSLELDRFIYSASHDIRSPISTARGVVNLMKLDPSNDTSRKYVEMVEKSLNKLDSFVGELTEFAKNSRQPVRDIEIDFNTLLPHVLEDLKGHTHFMLINFEMEISAKSAFFSDRERIRLALRNVLTNALDFIDRNKSCRTISIGIVVDGAKSEITIFDNGIGIAPIYIARVFDMFYKASNVSTGSGLGLYTTREAISRLGGIVTINSEYGIGTSVKISIPNSRKGMLVNRKNALRSAYKGNVDP